MTDYMSGSYNMRSLASGDTEKIYVGRSELSRDRGLYEMLVAVLRVTGPVEIPSSLAAMPSSILGYPVVERMTHKDSYCIRLETPSCD